MAGSTSANDQPKHPRVSENPYLEKLAGYLQEEREYRFPYFTSAVAFDLGLALRARHISWSVSDSPQNPVVICIATFSGAILFQCVAGGDPPDAADLNIWATAKANIVRRFGHSSAFVECRLLATGKPPTEAGLKWPEYVAAGGAFPICLQNAPVSALGAITVAGLSHCDDHRLIVETLSDFIPSLTPPHTTRRRLTSEPTSLLGAQRSIRQSHDPNGPDDLLTMSSPQPISTGTIHPQPRNEHRPHESDDGYESRSSSVEGQESGGAGSGRAPWR